MRSDRLSSYEQWNLDIAEALKNEGRRGLPAIQQETRAGASRFASGKGRGGSFADL
jgi:enoyl-CoA hydratase